jgi:hypothetical protein
MKFISTWSVPQGTFNAAAARFLIETGGAPPEGVKMLGRWHGMDGKGFAISESTDPKAMYRWTAQWADLLPLTVTPCLEDADAGEVIFKSYRSHRGQSSGSGGTKCSRASNSSRAGEHPFNRTGS